VASSTESSPLSLRSAMSRVGTSPLSLASGKDEICLDKETYQNMCDDIVSIKSMLLKLNSVLAQVRYSQQFAVYFFLRVVERV